MTRAVLSEESGKGNNGASVVCGDIFFVISDWFDPDLSRLTVVQQLQ